MKKEISLFLLIISIILVLNMPIALIDTYKSKPNISSDDKIQKSNFKFISVESSNAIAKKNNNTNQKIPKNKDGWTTANVNIRKEPSLNGEIIETLPFNTHIIYSFYSAEWVKIQFSLTRGRDKTIISGYINSAYIADKECSYIEHTITSNDGFKSFMDYKTITSKATGQYKLQNEFAYTGNFGIRQVSGRYCIAVGTAFNAQIGDYTDLILENGNVISCIVGDIKADEHTNVDNITTTVNGCVSEFIVDTSVLPSEVKLNGNISLCLEEWNSKVVEIKIYDKNIFYN